MISSEVFPDNGQLEPCSEKLPDNGFSHSETNPDIPSIPPGLEESNHNYFCHVEFVEDSSMTSIVDLATEGLQRLAHLSGYPPNNITIFCAKQL